MPNITEIIEPFLQTIQNIWPAILVLIFCAVVGIIIKSRLFKGKAGEAAVGTLAKIMLPKEYVILNDILLPRSDNPGMTTQLDHIVVSQYGLFVIETKNYHGKIYGSEKGKVWTYYPGGKKTTFPNPLHQNYLHTRTLADLLKIPIEVIHSVIVFGGAATFKNKIADNVGNFRTAKDYILTFKDKIFSASDVKMVIDEISKLKLDNTHQNRKQHVKDLKTSTKKNELY